jgi:hypothetical protein
MWVEAMESQASDGAGLVPLARGAGTGAEQRWNVLLLLWALRQPGLRDFLVAEVDTLEPAAGGFEFRTRADRDAVRAKLESEATEIRTELIRRGAAARKAEAEAEVAELERSLSGDAA